MIGRAARHLRHDRAFVGDNRPVDIEPEPGQRGASSVYWARMTAVKNGRLAAAASNLLDLTILPFPPDAWPEPRYHVLVGREGTDDAIGVRVARTRRRARRQLAEVEEILARSTEAEARAVLELDF
jgi:hypothetical protein